MSADSSQTAESTALAQQVEEVYRESAALTGALARGRSMRRILLLLTLLLILAVVLVFVQFVRGFMDPEFTDRLAAVAQKRLEAKEYYLKELQQIYDGVSPVLSEALNEQIKKDMPTYLQAMDKERDELAKNITAELEKRIEERYARLLVDQEKTIQDAFPQIKDAVLHERMIKNIDRAVQKLVKKYYVDEMETQFRQLYGAWDDFPPAPAPQPGDLSVEEQFIAELLDMLRYKLSHSPQAVPR